MKSLYEFDDYKAYLVTRVHSMPKRGHGQYLKIAKFLDVHTTMVTQVLRGNLHFNLEHAIKLCEFLGFNSLESDYFMTLVQKERAGNSQLKKYFSKKLQSLKEEAQDLSQRLVYDKTLDQKDQALFYSNWYYSGIRLLTSIPEYQNIDAISEKLNIPKSHVNRVIEFLLSVGLCAMDNGKLQMGPARTYVGSDSLLVSRHHANWRIKALEKLNSLPQEELAFTNPVTISKKDFENLREEIIKFIEKFRTVVDTSPAQQLCFLNIDWMKL